MIFMTRLSRTTGPRPETSSAPEIRNRHGVGAPSGSDRRIVRRRLVVHDLHRLAIEGNRYARALGRSQIAVCHILDERSQRHRLETLADREPLDLGVAERRHAPTEIARHYRFGRSRQQRQPALYRPPQRHRRAEADQQDQPECDAEHCEDYPVHGVDARPVGSDDEAPAAGDRQVEGLRDPLAALGFLIMEELGRAVRRDRRAQRSSGAAALWVGDDIAEIAGAVPRLPCPHGRCDPARALDRPRRQQGMRFRRNPVVELPLDRFVHDAASEQAQQSGNHRTGYGQYRAP